MPPKAQPIALRIELQGVTPLVWRRVVVSNAWTLASLHNYLQWVLGWRNAHAHEFRIAERCIAPAWWLAEVSQFGAASALEDERRVSVAAIVRELGVGGEFEYHYDMGDDWTHRIVIEDVPAPWVAHQLGMPACIAGEGACPPEDVGGPHGYRDFLDGMSDPQHPQHGDLRRWIGGVFDPGGFDLNRINRDWRPGRR